MSRTAAILIVLGGAASSGCIGGLDSPVIVKTPRILAMVAEPPEAPPGTSQSFDAMISVPADVPRPLSLRWRSCVDPVSVLEETGLDIALPIEPPPCDEQILPEGAPYVVEGARTTSLVATLRSLGTIGGFEPELVETLISTAGIAFVVELDVLDAQGNVLVSGFKRGAVTTRPNPTTNPPPPHVTFGDIEIVTSDRFTCTARDGTPIAVATMSQTKLTPILPAGASEEPWLESFYIFDYTGGITTGRENAYYSWFLTGGGFSRDLSRPPNRDTTFTAHPDPGTYSIWLVIRDGHLGTSACRLEVRVGG